MSSQLTLSQRLKNAREQDGRTEVEAMTMAQLSKERVTFGAKYVNYTYQHMWDNHPDWIQFMVDRYANSEKKDHQKLMRFVNLKLECVECAQDQMPVMPKRSQARGSLGQQAKYKAMPQPKAKAKGIRLLRDQSKIKPSKCLSATNGRRTSRTSMQHTSRSARRL